MEILIHTLKHSLLISVFVFIMMVLIDYLNVLTRGKITTYIKGGQWRQYLISSFLGATPGCLGAFMSVSLYVHGLISFGALTACMIATSGDESFVMLAMFPFKALFIFFILFIIGTLSGPIVDKIIKLFNLKVATCCELPGIHEHIEECRIFSLKQGFKELKTLSLEKFLLLALIIVYIYGVITGKLGPQEWGWERITFLSLLFLGFVMVFTAPNHYLQTHIWKHIFKNHFFRVLAWTFLALFIVNYGLKFWNLETFVKNHMVGIFFIALIVGIIPESGPHMVFVMMFAKGLIPFSVLLASSIVQDGHGMLPLLSHSVRDSLAVKMFNIVIGFILGGALYLLGF